LLSAEHYYFLSHSIAAPVCVLLSGEEENKEFWSTYLHSSEIRCRIRATEPRSLEDG